MSMNELLILVEEINEYNTLLEEVKEILDSGDGKTL